MIQFPVLEAMTVDGYGLYPGSPEAPGLTIAFNPGLTLVVGANGLGKSTLIQLIYRMLTGPYEISGLERSSELGNMNTAPTLLVGAKRGTFAARDATGAKAATATLACKFGKKHLKISRRLSDMSLVECSLADRQRDVDESQYQKLLLELVGLSSFGDFILLLRHLTFYFEDRRSLIWDPSAQRQLLRLLFLPPNQAARWISEERGILELDSRMRNLRAIVGREEQTATTHSEQASRGEDVRHELDTCEVMQSSDLALRDTLDSNMIELDAHRQSLRLRHLQVEQEHESNQREYERAKLAAIRSRFPSTDETSAFIIARLITDSHCLVCGNVAPKVAVAQYKERIDNTECVVCGTDLHGQDNLLSGAEFADAAVEAVLKKMKGSAEELDSSAQARDKAEEEFNDVVMRLAKLDVEISQRSQRIESLTLQLPPEEGKRREQLSELAALRRRLEANRLELDDKLAAFRKFVANENKSIQRSSEKIKAAFNNFATGFLLEDCSLIWAPYSSRVGQTGEPMLFPAFGLQMTGSNFSSPTRREGPDQVSESQREFIDLAFRMALMKVSGAEPQGASLIIDAPESSLDAVFATRAADVLARFSVESGDNRLLVTSNLVEGKLLPSLIGKAFDNVQDAKDGLVNLLEIAAPTAAVKSLRAEYDSIFDGMMAEAFHQ